VIGKKTECSHCGRAFRIHDVGPDEQDEDLKRLLASVKIVERIDDDDMEDDDADFDDDRATYRDDPSQGRSYVHKGCGGATTVSGGDFTHICDPFWPCTATYCCGCSDFVPLDQVRWLDTNETVAKFRRRMRQQTPAFVAAWRYGLGFAIGAALGSGVGLLVTLPNRQQPNNLPAGLLIGGLVGGLIAYLLGTIVLNLVCKIDYRRCS